MEASVTKRPYVLWRRVSTKEQGNSGLGLEAQLTMAEYCMKEKPEAVFTDVYSGTKLNECTELWNAIRYCKEKGYLLVIAKTDRFRNVKEALEILDAVGEGNLNFCDLPTTDRMILTIIFAVRVGPFVPDAYVVLVQVADVGLPPQEPQQFVDDGFEVEFFGGYQREAFREVETHLVAEYRTGAGAGAVGFVRAVIQDVLQQVEVLFHGINSSKVRKKTVLKK